MNELVRKIEANYLALANIERIKRVNHIKDDDIMYISSKNNVVETLDNNLKEYKKLTGSDFEPSEDLKRILAIEK